LIGATAALYLLYDDEVKIYENFSASFDGDALVKKNEESE
jgi:hypothetical protein